MKNWIEIGEHNRENPITINLLADEEAINITKKSEKTDWEYLFTNLEPYQDIAQEYKNTVDEIDIPKYTHAVFSSEDPTNIQLEVEIIGKKIWKYDSIEKRPDSIVVYLLANNKKVAEKIVTAKDNWKYRFSNVPQYDATGAKISYTIKEIEVSGYETSYEGYNIVNDWVDQANKSSIKKNQEMVYSKKTKSKKLAPYIVGGVFILAGLLLGKKQNKK